MMCMDAKATPTNDTNHSCHIKAIKPITLGLRISQHITPLVIIRRTGTHTYHIDVHTKTINFQETRYVPACSRYAPGLKILIFFTPSVI